METADHNANHARVGKDLKVIVQWHEFLFGEYAAALVLQDIELCHIVAGDVRVGLGVVDFSQILEHARCQYGIGPQGFRLYTITLREGCKTVDIAG